MVFGKVDTEAERGLAQAAQITSIPTLMAFKNGTLVFSQPGALPASALEQVIAAVRAGPRMKRFARRPGASGLPDGQLYPRRHARPPYEETVQAVRRALDDQGFGVLTEIDLRATLKKKLDVDVAPQIILGACRPPLAYEAMQTDPSLATVLPCNVVVRAIDDNTTMVEAFDPDVMLGLSGECGPGHGGYGRSRAAHGNAHDTD